MNSSEYRFRGLFYREPGKFGRTPDRLFDVPWTQEAFEALFPELVLEDKESTQMWAAISLFDGKTRGNASVDKVYAVILDKDCANVGDLNQTMHHLSKQKLAYAVLTSHSHRRKSKVHVDSERHGPFDCFRVVLPVSRALNPDEYRLVHAAVFASGVVPADPTEYAAEVAGKFKTQRNGVQTPCKPRGWDPTADQPARPWFLPCAPQETAGDAILDVVAGSVLDVEALLRLPGLPSITTRPPMSVVDATEGSRQKFFRVAEALEQAGFPLSNTDPDSNCRGTCPVCSDVSPSLCVSTNGERVLLHCFAGCATKDILAAVGLNFGDLETDALKEARSAAQAADMDEFMASVDERLGGSLREMLNRPVFDADPVDPNPVIDAIVPLLAARDDVFVSNENKLARVVRIKGDASLPVVIEPAANDWLRPTLCSVARWTKPVKDGDKPVPATRDFTAMVLSRRDYPGVREIRGITMSPFFRTDGTLVTKDGYDAASGTWLALQGVELPEIQEHPSLDDARKATAKLKSLVSDFNFGDARQTSVWLSTVLTALVRPLRSPMHLFNAANPGTGKGLICATAMAIVFGSRRVVQNWTMSEEENEKRLVSLAVQGSPVVWIDNVAPNCVLGGAALEGGITEGSVGRELGSSKNAPALNNVTFLANGNNVRLTRDMGRRTLRAELVATCADPSSRPASTFKVANLLEHVMEHQAEYLAAALTVMRAYFAAGKPKQDVVSISFPEWSSTVASALVWVGEHDPAACSVMLAEKGAVDEGTEALITLCDVIRKLQGEGAIKPSKLLQIAPADNDYERTMEALEIMGLRTKEADGAKVGRILGSKANSIVRLDDGTEVKLLREKNTNTKAFEYRVAELAKVTG